MPGIFETFKLNGRVAVVSGGAGFLGMEFCRTLSEAGASVAITDIDGTAASQLAENLNQKGSPVIGIGTDVTDKDSVERCVSHILDRLGRLDILVNSAALDPKFDPRHRSEATNAFEDFPIDAWDEALKVNLTGIFLFTQAAVRPMLAQGRGVIINLCSTYGLVGPDQRIYEREKGPSQFKPVHYSVTKAGVLGMTRYLATYYAGKNIRVNALTPGGVFADHDDIFVENYSARTVLGRMAEHDEMNGALLFLASDASSYMTGANLVVDGGWTAW